MERLLKFHRDYLKQRQLICLLLGYGCKAFVLSLIENAISISNGELSANKIGQILNCGKKLLNMPATPLQGVRCVLETLNNVQRKYKMVVFTKGELLDQENKLRRSGLQSFSMQLL